MQQYQGHVSARVKKSGVQVDCRRRAFWRCERETQRAHTNACLTLVFLHFAAQLLLLQLLQRQPLSFLNSSLPAEDNHFQQYHKVSPSHFAHISH